MTNPKDLDEMLVALVNKTEEHLGHSGRTVDSDHIKQTKAQILKHYRHISDIKEAVEEPKDVWRSEEAFRVREEYRKEIYTALGIEEGEDE